MNEQKTTKKKVPVSTLVTAVLTILVLSAVVLILFGVPNTKKNSDGNGTTTTNNDTDIEQDEPTTQRKLCGYSGYIGRVTGAPFYCEELGMEFYMSEGSVYGKFHPSLYEYDTAITLLPTTMDIDTTGIECSIVEAFEGESWWRFYIENHIILDVYVINSDTIRINYINQDTKEQFVDKEFIRQTTLDYLKNHQGGV